MALGARVRQMFGRYEPAVSRLYRALFIDFDRWIALVRQWAPAPDHILEVGCGEGYSTARIVAAFPGIPVDAIDIAGNIGRLYDGPPAAAKFRIAYAQEIAAERPAHYSTAILSDVIHHVPPAERKALLEAIRQTLAPGGVLIFKDFARTATPIFAAAFASDRWLTGDRVAFLTPAEAAALSEEVIGPGSIAARATGRPWRNNFAFRVVRG